MEINKQQTFIGLDIGESRIGVARIHSEVRISEPLDLIDAKSENVFSLINNVIDEYQASGVVVGLPRGLDGQETSQTEYCRNFAHQLSSKIKIPVYMIDEAGTSKAADERMQNNTKFSRDSVAAAILLEDFVSFDNTESLRV